MENEVINRNNELNLSKCFYYIYVITVLSKNDFCYFFVANFLSKYDTVYL